jgi:hypothetical protein
MTRDAMRTRLDDLKPGMKSADVLEIDTRPLLPAGTDLTDRHLWGSRRLPCPLG